METKSANNSIILLLTYLMFFMFAMTTDAVGVVIPRLIEEYNISLTSAGAFHYSTMLGIALSGLFLGTLADKLGRKVSIILGLSIYSIASLLFSVFSQFEVFLVLLFASGMAIGIFKTAAVALIGDISTDSKSHTKTMNLVEGYFGIGAIIGPFIVTQLFKYGASWKALYIIAACLCILLIIAAYSVKYPEIKQKAEGFSFKHSLALVKDKHALLYSGYAMLYVATETAIYVWMPTFLKGYTGSLVLLVTYSLSIFFILRAFGRFFGAWLMTIMDWKKVLSFCSFAIAVCFIAAMIGGNKVGVISLPLSGLFMSVIYPTINSKGISGFDKSKHGAASGIILFFTCVSAVVAPLIMGAVSDAFGDAKYGFYLATAFSIILFIAFLSNQYNAKAEERLAQIES